MAVRDVVQAAAGVGGDKLYVEDVFSTYLYTGTNVAQTITNGIDLAGEGGMVWTKEISPNARAHFIGDSERDNFQNYLYTNLTNSQTGIAGAGFDISSVSSTGYALGVNRFTWNNELGSSQASWTFRKAPKFFDVVTYTGTGAAQTIAHSLEGTVGALIIKRTSGTGNWATFARTGGSAGSTLYAYFNSLSGLNLNAAAGATGIPVESIGYITTTGFKPNELSGSGAAGNADNINESGATYVAYLFAHDAGGFGGDGEQNVISCGSFVSGSPGFVTLGYEPQWLLIKRSDSSTYGGWYLIDAMRGLTGSGSGNSTFSYANTTDVEFVSGINVHATATGFTESLFTGGTYIYIAIRRGPMKTPESGTEVFAPVARTGTGVAASISSLSFPPDAVITRNRTSNGSSRYAFYDKLRGSTRYLDTAATDSEFTVAESLTSFNQDGESFGTGAISNFSGDPYINWNFRRAPGFFDVVAYRGSSTSGHQIPHNLNVPPELIIVKNRSYAQEWPVSVQNISKRGELNTSTAFVNDTIFVGDADKVTINTATWFAANNSSYNYIMYLFATCPGVSKVGSYTGTGTTLAIDCGFSAGARFVLIKRTDSNGDWYVWDTARGIVSGNDPYLLLNSTASEVTSTDYIDPSSAGFEISSTAPAAINASGGSFIFFAVA